MGGASYAGDWRGHPRTRAPGLACDAAVTASYSLHHTGMVASIKTTRIINHTGLQISY